MSVGRVELCVGGVGGCGGGRCTSEEEREACAGLLALPTHVGVDGGAVIDLTGDTTDDDDGGDDATTVGGYDSDASSIWFTEADAQRYGAGAAGRGAHAGRPLRIAFDDDEDDDGGASVFSASTLGADEAPAQAAPRVDHVLLRHRRPVPFAIPSADASCSIRGGLSQDAQYPLGWSQM